MSSYVEYVRLTVQGRDLDDIVESITETSDRKVTAVNTMNRSRVAKGYKRGNNSYQLEIKADDLNDPTLPDWEALKAAGLEVTLVRVDSNGKKVTYGRVTVTRVVDNAQDADVTKTISAIALTKKKS